MNKQTSLTPSNHSEVNSKIIIPARVDFLQDPEISATLKGFALMVESVCSKFFSTKDLEKMKGKSKESPYKINTYLRLLRKHGYAKEFYYRHASTKQIAGTIWILTQRKNHFPDDTEINQKLIAQGFELTKSPNKARSSKQENDFQHRKDIQHGKYFQSEENAHSGNSHSWDSYGWDSHERDSYEQDSYESGSHGQESRGRENTRGENINQESPHPGKSYDRKSYDRKSYDRKSYDRKSYGWDSHERDSYEWDSHERDSYEWDSHERDSYEWDSHGKESSHIGNKKTQRYSTLTTPDEAGAGFGESQNCELEHGSIFDTPYIIYNNSTDNKNNNDYNHNMENTKYFPCPDPPPNSSSGGNEKTGSIESPKLESSNPEEEKFEDKKSSTDNPPSKSSGENKPRKKRQVKIPPLWMSEYDIQDFWNEPITPTMFETFKKFYPKIDCIGKARMAWSKICKRPRDKRPTLGQILGAIEAQKKSERWQEPQFIPDAGNWLLQERWNDDPSKLVLFKKRQVVENPPTKDSTTKPKPDYSWLDNVESIELDPRSLGWDGKIRPLGVNPNLRFRGWEPGFRDWW
jgi:hypothetical protein